MPRRKAGMEERSEEAVGAGEAGPEVKPAPAPEEAGPVAVARPAIKSSSWEEFEGFASERPSRRRSWVKEAIERAERGSVKVEGLTRGQIMALLGRVGRRNHEREPKILVKYDVKKGVVLPAPPRLQSPEEWARGN